MFNHAFIGLDVHSGLRCSSSLQVCEYVLQTVPLTCAEAGADES